jgi:hypothetical protein
MKITEEVEKNLTVKWTDVIKEEHVHAFHNKWIWLGAEKNVYFEAYASSDSELAMCRVSGIEKLCDDHEGRRG